VPNASQGRNPGLFIPSGVDRHKNTRKKEQSQRACINQRKEHGTSLDLLMSPKKSRSGEERHGSVTKSSRPGHAAWGRPTIGKEGELKKTGERGGNFVGINTEGMTDQERRTMCLGLHSQKLEGGRGAAGGRTIPECQKRKKWKSQ